MKEPRLCRWNMIVQNIQYENNLLKSENRERKIYIVLTRRNNGVHSSIRIMYACDDCCNVYAILMTYEITSKINCHCKKCIFLQ